MLGAVLNASLAHQVKGVATVTPNQLRQLLDHSAGVAGDTAVRAALGQSLNLFFWAVLLIAVLTLLLATLVPPGRHHEAGGGGRRAERRRSGLWQSSKG